MKNSRRFELRCEDKTWGVLSVSDQGKTLKHALGEIDVTMCSGLELYDEGDQPLSMKQPDNQLLLFCDQKGAIQLKCQWDGLGVTDVVDPAGNVGLVVNLVGTGSGANSPIVASGYVLNLRWLRE